MNAFVAIFGKNRILLGKKDKYCEELADKKVSRMELIERAEKILKKKISKNFRFLNNF